MLGSVDFVWRCFFYNVKLNVVFWESKDSFTCYATSDTFNVWRCCIWFGGVSIIRVTLNKCSTSDSLNVWRCSIWFGGVSIAMETRLTSTVSVKVLGGVTMCCKLIV